MIENLNFTPMTLPPECEEMRAYVRDFLDRELSATGFNSYRGFFNPEFSRKCGQAGLIGTTWPRQYGGQEKSFLERYVILEEFLARRAPVGAHWVGERQSGLQLLRFAVEETRQKILPGIARGEVYFGIGMSEPNSGSDLASVRTRAVKTDGGWVINGAKVWTSYAHRVSYLLVLARTGDPGETRHEGLTQFVVDMSAPGVVAKPITDLSGRSEFCEVTFDDYFVPDAMMLGREGEGWNIVVSELAFERSGPDRFLSSFQLFSLLLEELRQMPGNSGAAELGRLFSHLMALRQMSLSVAGQLQRGENPQLQAAVVKDLGTAFERAVPEAARLLASPACLENEKTEFQTAYAEVVQHAPSWTIRGGAREILRGIIARGLGLR